MARLDLVENKVKHEDIWIVQRNSGSNYQEFDDFQSAQAYFNYLQSLDNQEKIVKQQGEIISLLKGNDSSMYIDDGDDEDDEEYTMMINKRQEEEEKKELSNWKRRKLHKLEDQLIMNERIINENCEEYYRVASYTRNIQVINILARSKDPILLGNLKQNKKTPQRIKEKVEKRQSFYERREEEIEEYGRLGWCLTLIFEYGIQIIGICIITGILYLIFR